MSPTNFPIPRRTRMVSGDFSICFIIMVRMVVSQENGILYMSCIIC